MRASDLLRRYDLVAILEFCPDIQSGSRRQHGNRHQAEAPFIVFVADYVTPEQRALLSGAGALVRELAPLPWSPNVPDVQPRWKDLFAKLHMWRETEFARIFFLDADNRLSPGAARSFGLLLTAEPDANWFYPEFDFFGREGNFIGEARPSLTMNLLANQSEAGSLVRRATPGPRALPDRTVG